jgi:hypothetical protein
MKQATNPINPHAAKPCSFVEKPFKWAARLSMMQLSDMTERRSACEHNFRWLTRLVNTRLVVGDLRTRNTNFNL